MKPTPALVFSVAMLAGCVAPVKQTVPFDEAAFQPYLATGTATVTGQAFLKTQGGDVKYGAGDPVELIPVTPYTKERFDLIARTDYAGFTLVEPADPRLAQYIKTTTADGQGNFEFHNIPAGDYILHCVIQWQYATVNGPMTTGGHAVSHISIANGEAKKVVLTE